MPAWFYMKGDVLVPADEKALAGVRKMGEGECIEVSIIRPRSLQWHRMYFGICGSIGENQDPQRDADSVDYELRILSGHYDVVYIEGNEVRIPKRLAFSKLSAEKWAELWPSLELAIRQRFGNEYVSEGQKRYA